MRTSRRVVLASLDARRLTMAFERTLAALAVYRRRMVEGPSFGDNPGKAQRWHKECLAAAVDVREAFWMHSDIAYSREECLSMPLHVGR
jgi:hypothetical protein